MNGSEDINKQIRSLCAVIALSGVTLDQPLFAESGNYIGLQYGVTTYEENGTPELEPAMGILRIGWRDANRLSYEARFGTGLRSGEDRIFGQSSALAEVEVDSLFGAYVLADLDLSASFSLYGLLGITSLEATASASLGEFSDSVSHRESGPSFGIGLNYELWHNIPLNVEFVSYANGDDFSARTLSLGVTFR
jgi:opacity protein-like surface antigen